MLNPNLKLKLTIIIFGLREVKKAKVKKNKIAVFRYNFILSANKHLVFI